MLKVYYDGKCGLCRREIEYYKRVAPADRFEWLDIATDPAGLADLDISQADALRRLHACDASGNICSFPLSAESDTDQGHISSLLSGASSTARIGPIIFAYTVVI